MSVPESSKTKRVSCNTIFQYVENIKSKHSNHPTRTKRYRSVRNLMKGNKILYPWMKEFHFKTAATILKNNLKYDLYPITDVTNSDKYATVAEYCKPG